MLVIKLIPVTRKPKYTVQELETIDRIVAQEKHKGKVFKVIKKNGINKNGGI